MKKLMFMAMAAIVAMVACDKEVGTEDESAGTRAVNDSTDTASNFTFTADTAWTDTIFVDF